MAVVYPDSWANLQTVVAAELNRQDLADQIPVFIRLAESAIERQLRVPDMVNRAYATAAAASIPVPDDFLEMRYMTYRTPTVGGAMEYLSNEDFKRKEFENYTGSSRYFTIVGKQIDLLPAPSAGASIEVEMAYYQTIPRLSGTTTTNWLLNKHPDLYLYATLMQSAPWLIEDERIGTWTSIAGGIVESINAVGEKAIRPSTKLLARPNKSY